jgi:hypothetical protein
MSTPFPQDDNRHGGPPVGRPPTEPAPIKPLEPLENTQPEVPKVGTTDAPGG